MLVIVILLQALSYAAIENSGLKMPIHELIEVPLTLISVIFHCGPVNFNRDKRHALLCVRYVHVQASET